MARHFRPQTMDLYAKVVGPTVASISTRNESVNPNDQFYLASIKSPYQPKPSITQTHSQSSVPKINRIRSPIPFNKQIPRPQNRNIIDPHELRFVSFKNSPLIYSKTRRVQSPNIKKYLPRDFTKGTKNLANLPEYSPNYAAVSKKIPSILPFGRTVGRNQKPGNSSCTPKMAPAYSTFDGKAQAPALDKMNSRSQHSTLPSFMLKNSSRQPRNTVSYKTLEMNAYFCRDYMKLTSSFGIGWESKAHVPQPIRGKCPKIIKILMKKLKKRAENTTD